MGKPTRDGKPGRAEGRKLEGRAGPEDGQTIPTILTDKMMDKIVNLMRMGMYRGGAAAIVGINADTLYKWLKLGARYPEKYPQYAKLIVKIEKAAAEADLRDLDVVDGAAKKEWKAAAWKLERRNPKHFGKTERHELTGLNGGPIEHGKAIDLSKLSEEDKVALDAILRKAGADDPEADAD